MSRNGEFFSFADVSRQLHGFADGEEMVRDYLGDLTGDDPENLDFVLTEHTVWPQDDPGDKNLVWEEASIDRVQRYAGMYRQGGPQALPPILLADSERGRMRVDGGHRVVAAARAGLTHVPAFVARRRTT